MSSPTTPGTLGSIEERQERVVQAVDSLIDRTGLRQHLSPARSNALSSMAERMRSFAHAQVRDDAIAAEGTREA